MTKEQREPNNNTRSRDYEHHFSFMAMMVGPNPDVPGDDCNETYHPPGKPMETAAADEEYTSTRGEYEMYEEIKRLALVLTKVGNFLQGQHPDLLRTMKKINLFDGAVDEKHSASKSSHPGFYNLNGDLKAESECKPATQRERIRERERREVWILTWRQAMLGRKP